MMTPRPLFLLPFPLPHWARSSPHYHISSRRHITTVTPLNLAPLYFNVLPPHPPLQNGALYLPQSVPVRTATVIPAPSFSFIRVPVSVPPTVPLAQLPTVPALKDMNDVPLTRNLLTQALSDPSKRLYFSFRCQVCLVAHGGAVTVLHPSNSHRESTQDIDHILPFLRIRVLRPRFSRCRSTTSNLYR